MCPLYPDNMTKEEVMKEFARLIEPAVRKMYDEYEKKEKNKKSRRKNDSKIPQIIDSTASIRKSC